MGNELEKANEMLDSISEKLKDYLDIRDRILDNEYMQVFGDSSKIVGLLRNASSLISQKRFEAFLRGFKPDEIPTDYQLSKLRDYIDNEEKAQFISDTLSKILLSKSTKSCTILGIIMYDVIENQKNISYDYLVCIDALMNLFDKDIENVEFVYDYIATTKTGRFYREDKKFIDARKDRGVDKNSLELTLDKAVHHQVLRRFYEIDLDLDIDVETPSFSDGNVENDEYYSKTSPGNLLYNFIKMLSK